MRELIRREVRCEINGQVEDSMPGYWGSVAFFHGSSFENLLSFVPSAPHSAKAVMDNIGKAKTGPAPINLCIQCGRDLEIKDVSKFSM
ncbi:hypothetical protein N7471_006625 [Penicillium samsonianum]|uniref:uncharacterized protein n=1 Tax=Penicillium samsonianum TaxID=1882272 RepID=UPI00254968A1|nr:uncharacterized protein N7471_006625 [Penicillium samsonianum]KAJ6140139.1 hypothetical protein N7471_006625 [Penicillium samsonianum]